MFKKIKERIEYLEECNLNNLGLIADMTKQIQTNERYIRSLYDLYERLGDSLKRDRVDTANIFISVLKQIGCKLDENNNVIKNKNVKAISTPRKSSKRKST